MGYLRDMSKQSLIPDPTVHVFEISGCINQWHADHNDYDCWTAFLIHHGAPAGISVDEFYDKYFQFGHR